MNYPPPGNAESTMPCAADLYYTPPHGGKVRIDLSQLPNFFRETSTPDNTWYFNIEYNNDTCPWKLAMTALLPTDDWSLDCRVNNTCADPVDSTHCLAYRGADIQSFTEKGYVVTCGDYSISGIWRCQVVDTLSAH